VACGRGEETAEDCAIEHWCKALKKFNAHREPNGQWRADCPVPGCKSRRAIEFDAPGAHVRWKTFCGHHPKDVVRPYLAKLIGPCMPDGSRRAPIKHADLEALALSGLPPASLRLAMLEMAGLGTQEALDKLGVRPDNRARVIGGRTGGASKLTRNRRS
jgi:hypothetical protein